MVLTNRHSIDLAAYRRSGQLQEESYKADQNNRLLWRFSSRRLDAEAIRDQMLAVSGELSLTMGGAYIPTSRLETGEIVAPEDTPNSLRRTLYLNQKRTQVVSFLSVFDSPSIVFNSVRRNTSTMSLQSLSLLNSDFAVRRARAAATSILGLTSDEANRIKVAFQVFYCREPNDSELTESIRFLDQQTNLYMERPEARERAWQDFCQSLLASSEFMYVE